MMSSYISENFDNSGGWGQFIDIDDTYPINTIKNFGTHKRYINKCPTIIEDTMYDDFVRIHSSETMMPTVGETMIRFDNQIKNFTVHPVFAIGHFVLSCVKKIWK